MYLSKEIRWFKNHEDTDISNWFSNHGLTFSNTESRTDHYLPLNKEGMSVKLREGRIEAKMLISSPQKKVLINNMKGYYEKWSKWSFNVGENDSLASEIIGGKIKEQWKWRETVKTRIGVKIETNNKNVFSIKDNLDKGCQMEYTRVIFNNETYYTFALEYFSSKAEELESVVEVEKSLLVEILGKTNFILDDSKGYDRFFEGIK